MGRPAAGLKILGVCGTLSQGPLRVLLHLGTLLTAFLDPLLAQSAVIMQIESLNKDLGPRTLRQKGCVVLQALK